MITIKTKEDIKKLRKSCQICSFVREQILRKIKPGITTVELDNIASRIIEARGARPSFLNYKGYPKSICTSVNEELVHTIPGHRIIKNGDVVSIDVGVEFEGMFSDCASTKIVGKKNPEVLNLVLGVKEALSTSIKAVKPGAKIGDIESECGRILKKHKLSPVMTLSGHGVGYAVHEEPSIKSDGSAGTGETLAPGMVLAIEPMAAIGDSKVRTGRDGWSVSTVDKSLTAHFEETILVTQKGVEILT
ncbi:MAG: Methionine aminopeptidase 1 [candidate division WS2 bacterium ADurb.Bin280]|uniref:Methionine aminopeptidase n=1 Tax=candidate division WS2 bacterium ADurb.Bin280 TaxID=1852829 RepID=A0A1V5SC16_9BACT|nr:MAG: Methionine aminopeptidase 1 [candidate division WS2 bacterium ADurb.Bin280]